MLSEFKFTILICFLPFQLALSNALRYFPSSHHSELAPEFARELKDFGHIYMYRFIPDIELRYGIQL
jgi:hypothetical protein